MEPGQTETQRPQQLQQTVQTAQQIEQTKQNNARQNNAPNSSYHNLAISSLILFVFATVFFTSYMILEKSQVVDPKGNIEVFTSLLFPITAAVIGLDYLISIISLATFIKQRAHSIWMPIVALVGLFVIVGVYLSL